MSTQPKLTLIKDLLNESVGTQHVIQGQITNVQEPKGMKFITLTDRSLEDPDAGVQITVPLDKATIRYFELGTKSQDEKKKRPKRSRIRWRRSDVAFGCEPR